MNVLRRTEFGNPILRQPAGRVALTDISSKEIQTLIQDMRHTLLAKKLGIALAAPQVGKSLAVVVIAIRPSEYRPTIEPVDLVLINPDITQHIGRRKAMWEGCISSGRGGKADLFGKTLRYTKVKVLYYDQAGKRHHATYEGLMAQVIQHEVDHLHGTLFVDRVKDPKTYMTFNEYIKMVKHYLKEHPEARQ